MLEKLRVDKDSPIMLEKAVVPKLSEEQVKMVLTVIPVDYWSMRCRTCRGEVHSEFSCPYQYIDQRLHF